MSMSSEHLREVATKNVSENNDAAQHEEDEQITRELANDLRVNGYILVSEGMS